MRCGLTCYHKSWNLRCERGGGSKPQPAQVIPAPPAPSVSQTAAESLQSQLQYNPQLTAQALQLQQQYGPQFAQSQFDVTKQVAPQYQQFLYGLHPELQQYQQQVQQRMASPTGYSSQQQQAIDAIRQRSRDALSQQMRERANLGGNLFGGNAILNEGRALGELEQGFTAQDIGYQQQQQAANQQALVTLLQLTNPQVSQPNVPQFGQSVVPGGDNLYNALVNQQNAQTQFIPPTPGSPGFFGSFLRPFGF